MIEDVAKDEIKRGYFDALVKASDDAANKLMDSGVPELEAYEVILDWDIMSVASLVHVIGRFKGNAKLVGRRAEETLNRLIEHDEPGSHDGVPDRRVII